MGAPHRSITDLLIYITFGIVITSSVIIVDLWTMFQDAGIQDNTAAIQDATASIAHIRAPDMEHLLRLVRMIAESKDELSPSSVTFLINHLGLFQNDLPTVEQFQELINTLKELGPGESDWREPIINQFNPKGPGGSGGTATLIPK